MERQTAISVKVRMKRQTVRSYDKMSFSRYICRGSADRQGVDINSRGFDNLMKNEKALKGERGRTFADKLMNAMSRVNTNIPRPKLWADDRQEYYPLSVILMDREVEFVDEI